MQTFYVVFDEYEKDAEEILKKRIEKFVEDLKTKGEMTLADLKEYCGSGAHIKPEDKNYIFNMENIKIPGLVLGLQIKKITCFVFEVMCVPSARITHCCESCQNACKEQKLETVEEKEKKKDDFFKVLRAISDNKDYRFSFDVERIGKDFNEAVMATLGKTDSADFTARERDLKKIALNSTYGSISEKIDKPYRKAFIEIAEDYICKDREQQHGDPRHNFEDIADMWSIYLTRKNNNDVDDYIEITADDVCKMMVLFKIARSMSNYANEDNYIDMIGYAALAGEMAVKEAKENGDAEGKFTEIFKKCKD